MKKIFVIVAMMLAGATAFAQGLHIGAGYLQNNVSYESNVNTITGVNHGAYAGVAYSLPLADAVALTPGAFVSYLTGSRSNGNFSNTRYDLNVPVLLSYTADIESFSVSIAAGPLCTYGLAGTFDSKFTNISGDLFKDNGYNRLDVKGMAAVQFCFGKIGLNIGYAYGFLDQDKSDQLKGRSNYAFAGLCICL